MTVQNDRREPGLGTGADGKTTQRSTGGHHERDTTGCDAHASTGPRGFDGEGTVAAALATILLGAGWVHLGEAANQVGGPDHEVLVGRDDDNTNNPLIQPPDVPSPPGPNQSLNNTDLQVGRRGNDILIGLGGNDVQIGDDGSDIFIGGPGADVQFGGRGSDLSIWAPGDGSDAFIGGPGRDALVIGLIDRDPANAALPLLTNPTNNYPHGRPSVNISGTNGFCTIERVDDPNLGYEFLTRFFVRSTGSLAVTIRLSEVERVFCPGLTAGEIVFADLSGR